MSIQVNLLQFGRGHVGASLISQILANRQTRYNDRQVNWRYLAVTNSRGAYLANDTHTGLTEQALAALANGAKEITRDDGYEGTLEQALDLIKVARGRGECVIAIDLAAGSGVYDLDRAAMAQGASLVLANKAPLAGSLNSYQALWHLAAAHGTYLRHEATVGAGLPVISVIETLQATGDQIYSIEGCFSGTLGYLSTALEDDVPFSTAVHEAHARAYTEPDPRDDLSGLDVARKALILARKCGSHAELRDIEVESLVPAELTGGTTETFLAQINKVDEFYRQRVLEARAQQRTLRYVASVRPEGPIRVGFEAVPTDSPIGRLRATDNIIIIRSKRYDTRPLVIQGPGAGAEVTAAGVFGDLWTIALSRFK